MRIIEHLINRQKSYGTYPPEPHLIPNGTTIVIDWLPRRGENIIGVVVDSERTNLSLYYEVVIDNGELRRVGWMSISKWFSWSEDERFE